MNRFGCLLLCAALAALVGNSNALGGTQYVVAVGLDYGVAGQNWKADATNVSTALQAADPTAVITTLAGPAAGAGAITPAQVLNAIAADVAAAKAGDSFTFYYSGHGTYYGNPANPDTVGPSLNPCTEALYFSTPAMPANGLISEGDLTAAELGFAAGVTKLDFVDACFAGGLWFGPGPANALTGSLAIVPSTTLIAAADENSTAPGNSQISNNWIADINANGFNLTTMNAAALNAMFNRINPGGVIVAPNVKSPPGFPAPGPDNYYPYSPIDNPMSYYGSSRAQIMTNAPEPGTFFLAGSGLALALVASIKKSRRSATA